MRYYVEVEESWINAVPFEVDRKLIVKKGTRYNYSV
jgi:hypothetical protein